MADVYTPPGGFADISSFVADGNAINAATKTAIILAMTNIANLFGTYTTANVPASAAHPDFNKVSPAIRQKIQNELTVFSAAVTAHA